MAVVGVTHAKVVTVPDDGTSPVGTDEWNAGHVITGLENVDNTSDANKPVSTAQAAAIAAAVGGAWINTRLAKTAAYAVLNADKGKTIALGGAAFYALTFGAAAGYDANFAAVVVNEDSVRAKDVAISGGTTFRLYPGQSALVFNQNNVWRVLRNKRYSVTSALTFNVDNSLGSDSAADGLATGAGAFATVQHAVDVVCSDLDIVAAQVNIQLTSGQTYTEQVSLKNYVASGITNTQNNPTILGLVASKGNYIIDGTSGTAVTAVACVTPWMLKGITLNAATGSCLVADAPGTFLYLNGVKFGAAVTQIQIVNGATVEAIAGYEIAGSAATHMIISLKAMWLIQPGLTVTLTGTPAWSSNFIALADNGMALWANTTFSGTATGRRWNREFYSVLDVGFGVNPDTLFANAGNLNGVLTMVPVTEGGTGAITAGAARTALGVAGRNLHGDSNYTILASDFPLLQTSAGLTAARTWTLPAANSLRPGDVFMIVDAGGITGANTLTIQRGGTDTFQGVGVAANAITLSAQFNAIGITTDGVGSWFLLWLR